MATFAENVRVRLDTKRRPDGRRWSQSDLAAAVGVERNTVNALLNRGAVPRDPAVLAKVAETLGVSLEWLIGTSAGDSAVEQQQRPERASGGDEAFTPNPSLKNAVAPRAYEVALDYLRRLERAGIPADQIEEAERIMLDSRYAKLNKRDRREMSEEDQITMIDATWQIVAEVLAWQGIKP